MLELPLALRPSLTPSPSKAIANATKELIFINTVHIKAFYLTENINYHSAKSISNLLLADRIIFFL